MDFQKIILQYGMIKNRTDIKDFILQIERNYPVNNWKINNVHLWPILRIRLFFYLMKKIGETQKNDSKNNVRSFKKSFLKKVKGKFRQKLSINKDICYYIYWKLKLPRKENLFVGADSHRVNYRAHRFNRYFDVLIERDKLEDKSLYFEYKSNLRNQYNKHLIYKYNRALKGFSRLKRTADIMYSNFDGYSDFLNMLKDNPMFSKFAERYAEVDLLAWYKKGFGVKLLFFDEVLNKIKPKQVAVLCYYSEDLFALLAASNKKGISTIDMQHGPQTDIHLSYGSWSCVPAEGYDVLPRTFWCWDVYSKEVMEKWTSKNNLYSAIVIGNLWVDYWKSKSNTYKHKDFILYSLQPSPITLEQTFTPHIIDLIKKCEYKWFIRLHPRQLDQISEIKELLQKENVLHLVNIDEATNDPLPELLANAKLHVTHFSGTALEANLFGLKTLFINELGKKSFAPLLNNRTGCFIDYHDDLFSMKFNKIINEL